MIEEGDADLVGPIRQEILSGVKDLGQFDRLKDALRAFQNEDLTEEDYETAAAFFNRCRTAGIQGSNTDFLICAVSARLGIPIFTLDEDFTSYARVLPVHLIAADV